MAALQEAPPRLSDWWRLLGEPLLLAGGLPCVLLTLRPRCSLLEDFELPELTDLVFDRDDRCD